MTDRRPDTPDALPDELLLDLVEGTLRASDVERVREALKADPKLARRVEALREDRRVIASMGDPGVARAPEGLVADAINAAERTDLLDDTPAPKRSLVRTGAPFLLAACVGVAAVAGWYLVTQSQTTAPSDGASLAEGPDAPGAGVTLRRGQVDPADTELGRERRAVEEFGDLFDAGDESILPDTVADADRTGAVGAPIDPGSLVRERGSDGAPATTDDAVAGAPVWDETTTGDPPDVPRRASTWAREGVLALIIDPPAGAAGSSDEDRLAFTRSVASRLRIAIDPSLANGWAMTRVPFVPVTSFASASGAGPSEQRDVVARASEDWERPMLATMAAPRDADDEHLRAVIERMATGVQRIAGHRVRVERVTGLEAPAPGSAMTIANLLWWRTPADLWEPTDVYHVPILTRPLEDVDRSAGDAG